MAQSGTRGEEERVSLGTHDVRLRSLGHTPGADDGAGERVIEADLFAAGAGGDEEPALVGAAYDALPRPSG